MRKLVRLACLGALLACGLPNAVSPAQPGSTPSSRPPETDAWFTPAPTADASPLLISVFEPLAIELLNSGHVAEYESALDTIRQAIPQTTHVGLFFDGSTTGRGDWLAILDATQRHGLKAQVAFAQSAESNAAMFRPAMGQGQWQLGPLESFFTCAECAGHPALYGVMVVDEPWHHEKRPFYSTEVLLDLHAALKGLAPEGTDPRLILQFSRELWRQIVDSANRSGLAWQAGMAELVQISALEFQDGTYQFALLDSNHYWSRKIIHEATPGIPLWTSAQVFGARLGPHNGCWFPAADDLRVLLDDLVDPRYQAEHRLAGIGFQKWDSDTVAGRPRQFTLGDAFLPGQPAEQVRVAEEALLSSQEWLMEGSLP
ncbi:MAG: hypothetical protein ACRDHY_08690 [Anaerolineales bacterium]